MDMQSAGSRRPEVSEYWHQFASLRMIVENSMLEPWYERLNTGRRITHLWTTDSHDAGLLPPGARRTYIYTGGELSEKAIVQGLKSGRSFNTRSPGAWLEVEVNGATMGQTAANSNGVSVEADSASA